VFFVLKGAEAQGKALSRVLNVQTVMHVSVAPRTNNMHNAHARFLPQTVTVVAKYFKEKIT
jgi:hypothetical protein